MPYGTYPMFTIPTEFSSCESVYMQIEMLFDMIKDMQKEIEYLQQEIDELKN